MGSNKKKAKKILSPPQNPSQNEADDEELVDDLLAHLDSKDKNVQHESAVMINEMQMNQDDKKGKQDSKGRFTARQARKAAALTENHSPDDADADARLERETKEEEKAISRVCDELGVEMHEINPDGHCLFAAVADQLVLLSILPPFQANYATIRHAAANYIYTHPDDFIPFLPSVMGEDGIGANEKGFMGPNEFERYCASIRDTGVWGGEPEILALSRAYRIPIHVIQAGNTPVVVHDPSGVPNTQSMKYQKAVRISYHRRMYGLGEHYNSLRPKSGLHRITSPIKNFLT